MKTKRDSATLVDRVVMHSAGHASLTVDVEQRFDLPNACVSVELVVRQKRISHYASSVALSKEVAIFALSEALSSLVSSSKFGKGID
jgi:3,4-dihydroxy-2-butanone 4-phosphate synthase